MKAYKVYSITRNSVSSKEEDIDFCEIENWLKRRIKEKMPIPKYVMVSAKGKLEKCMLIFHKKRNKARICLVVRNNKIFSDLVCKVIPLNVRVDEIEVEK